MRTKRRTDAHRGCSAQRARDDCRHGRVHVPGAGHRRNGGCAERYLQLWRTALRDGHRGRARLRARPRPTRWRGASRAANTPHRIVARGPDRSGQNYPAMPSTRIGNGGSSTSRTCELRSKTSKRIRSRARWPLRPSPRQSSWSHRGDGCNRNTRGGCGIVVFVTERWTRGAAVTCRAAHDAQGQRSVSSLRHHGGGHDGAALGEAEDPRRPPT